MDNFKDTFLVFQQEETADKQEDEEAFDIMNLMVVPEEWELHTRHQLESVSLSVVCRTFLKLLLHYVKPSSSQPNAALELQLCTRYVKWRTEHERYALLLEEFDLIIPQWLCSLPEKILRITKQNQPLNVIISVLKERSQQLVKLRKYPTNAWHFMEECVVCFDKVCCLQRSCCAAIICDDCLTEYFKIRVHEGLRRMACPNANCDSVVPPMEIFGNLPEEDHIKYIRLFMKSNSDPCCKTCPQCCKITRVSNESLKKASKKKGLAVQCVQCGLHWCFSCHAPQNLSLSCKLFQTGQILLKKWAKMRNNDHSRKAQKCPKCDFYIERTEGCDHMTCSRCETEFCYGCGERFVNIKFIAKHTHKYSIFGCPQLLMPNKPHVRRLLRGTIFASILLGSGPVLMLALPMVVVVAVLGFPSILIYKKINKLLKNMVEGHRVLVSKNEHQSYFTFFHGNEANDVILLTYKSIDGNFYFRNRNR